MHSIDYQNHDWHDKYLNCHSGRIIFATLQCIFQFMSKKWTKNENSQIFDCLDTCRNSLNHVNVDVVLCSIKGIMKLNSILYYLLCFVILIMLHSWCIIFLFLFLFDLTDTSCIVVEPGHQLLRFWLKSHYGMMLFLRCWCFQLFLFSVSLWCQ